MKEIKRSKQKEKKKTLSNLVVCQGSSGICDKHLFFFQKIGTINSKINRGMKQYRVDIKIKHINLGNKSWLLT